MGYLVILKFYNVESESEWEWLTDKVSQWMTDEKMRIFEDVTSVFWERPKVIIEAAGLVC